MEHPRRLRDRPVGVGALLEAQASAPFRSAEGPIRGLVSAGVAAGVAVGLAGIFDPVVAVVTVLVAAGLVAGALVTINPTGVARLVAATVGAAFVGAMLTLPLSIELLATGFRGIRLPTGEPAIRPPNRSPTFCALQSAPIRPRFSPGHSSSP